ncbi:Holliday junction branch migration protein RuvA [Balneolales bacterium ANBcel1]|nr:Holliday junction branch migration protein RuvA [Balneolales bacterium ANBcel1]
MIAFLHGTIHAKASGEVLLDVNGVGYRVRISNHTLDKIPATGELFRIHIHHHISENDQQLFGFASREEKNLFELLITVKSIGPRLALALLSAMPPNDIIDAILHQDPGLIAKSPGIGKKSAERIVLELRDKLGEIAASHSSGIETGSVLHETVSALEALGYPGSLARKAVQQVLKQDQTPDNVPELLKRSLKFLQT